MDIYQLKELHPNVVIYKNLTLWYMLHFIIVSDSVLVLIWIRTICVSGNIGLCSLPVACRPFSISPHSHLGGGRFKTSELPIWGYRLYLWLLVYHPLWVHPLSCHLAVPHPQLLVVGYMIELLFDFLKEGGGSARKNGFHIDHPYLSDECDSIIRLLISD